MNDNQLAEQLKQQLADYRVDGLPLPGIQNQAALATLAAQIIESVHRVKYVTAIANRPISPRRLDPKDVEMFDPLRAAIVHMRTGNVDEGFWLVFLFALCGKNLRKGYGLLRMIYGAYKDQFMWTWERFSSQPGDFSIWLHQHLGNIKQERANFPFGNHRKYESLDSLDVVLSSYADWIGAARSHGAMIQAAQEAVGPDPKNVFDYLYHSMDAVHRFGRTGKFDYLTMLGKIGLAPIEPPYAYMNKASGPAYGARLLFGGDVNFNIGVKRLETLSVALGEELNLGMQVIEDSLCNWQKSPNSFVAFRG